MARRTLPGGGVAPSDSNYRPARRKSKLVKVFYLAGVAVALGVALAAGAAVAEAASTGFGVAEAASTGRGVAEGGTGVLVQVGGTGVVVRVGAGGTGVLVQVGGGAGVFVAVAGGVRVGIICTSMRWATMTPLSRTPVTFARSQYGRGV